MPVRPSVAAGPDDEQHLVLRRERRDLQCDTGRRGAGQDLVTLPDVVGRGRGRLGRVTGVVGCGHLDRPAVHGTGAVGGVVQPDVERVDVHLAVGLQRTGERGDQRDLDRLAGGWGSRFSIRSPSSSRWSQRCRSPTSQACRTPRGPARRRVLRARDVPSGGSSVLLGSGTTAFPAHTHGRITVRTPLPGALNRTLSASREPEDVAQHHIRKAHRGRFTLVPGGSPCSPPPVLRESAPGSCRGPEPYGTGSPTVGRCAATAVHRLVAASSNKPSVAPTTLAITSDTVAVRSGR